MKIEVLKLLDGVKTVVETAAIVIGGFWTYWLYVRGRTHKPRLEPNVRGAVEKRDSKFFLNIQSSLKNVGLRKVHFDRAQSGVAVYPAEAIGAGEMMMRELKWAKRCAFDVFMEHEWIEPGETISDAMMIELPQQPAAAYKLHLKLVDKSNKQDWTSEAIAQAPLPEPKDKLKKFVDEFKVILGGKPHGNQR